MKIEVLRAFIHDKETVQPGAVIDVSVAFGKEMIGCNKAKAVEPEPTPEPLSTTNAGAVVSGRQDAKK